MMIKLSIVTTLFHSEKYIADFYKRMSAEANKFCQDQFEIIFVNDGSPDRSLEIVIEIAKDDSKVILVDLSRNFGHHQAMMCGLSFANGQHVFLIDSDLEEMPEWLSRFNIVMNLTSSDVVFGVQNTRKGNYFEQITGAIFTVFLEF